MCLAAFCLHIASTCIVHQPSSPEASSPHSPLPHTLLPEGLEHNPVVALGKRQAEAPVMCYMQLKWRELCSLSVWGAASIKAPSPEGPHKRRPLLAAFLAAAKRTLEPSVPHGVSRR